MSPLLSSLLSENAMHVILPDFLTALILCGKHNHSLGSEKPVWRKGLWVFGLK